MRSLALPTASAAAAMVEVAAAVVVAALAAPHLLPWQRVTPRSAVALWLSALFLRSVLALVGAALALALLPQTAAYAAVAGATWHEVLPVLTAHFDVSGDPFAHAAALLPAVLLALGTGLFLVGAVVARSGLRTVVRRRSLGRGPGGSIVIADPRVLVAVTGFGPRQLLVSDTALAVMDDAELEASLAHEKGHLRRGHRVQNFVASLLAAVGCLLPGSRASARGLRLSLEREADEYAVARSADPLALASAICKAAQERSAPAGALALGGQGTVVRLEQLMGSAARSSPVVESAVLGLSAVLVLLALAVLVGVLAVVGLDGASLQLGLACAS